MHDLVLSERVINVACSFVDNCGWLFCMRMHLSVYICLSVLFAIYLSLKYLSFYRSISHHEALYLAVIISFIQIFSEAKA